MAIRFTDPVPSILEEVKARTGKGIEFIEKDNLSTYAALKMARISMPSHLIFYKKEHNELINHLIAHECGHIFRMYSSSEDKRLIPYSTQQIKLRALSEIEDEIAALSSVLSFDQLSQIINMWYSGIVRQVTNMPPDIMIEKWIYDSYPALRPLQLKSIQKQLAESVAGLSDTVQRITPPTIVNASNLMNYVFFRLLGNHFGINFVKPYSTTQYINKGKELALITENEYVNSYEGDIKMINRWAEFLSLSRWFSWTDFESVPENYLAND